MAAAVDAYWTVSKGLAPRAGWSCRECKRAIEKNEPYISRDGRKLRLFYHTACFSGASDPRTQPTTLQYAVSKFGGTIQDAAPPTKGRGKWSVGSYGSYANAVPIVVPVSTAANTTTTATSATATATASATAATTSVMNTSANTSANTTAASTAATAITAAAAKPKANPKPKPKPKANPTTGVATGAAGVKRGVRPKPPTPKLTTPAIWTAAQKLQMNAKSTAK